MIKSAELARILIGRDGGGVQRRSSQGYHGERRHDRVHPWFHRGVLSSHPIQRMDAVPAAAGEWHHGKNLAIPRIRRLDGVVKIPSEA